MLPRASALISPSAERDAVLWQASSDQAGDYLHQGRRGSLYKPDMVTPEGGASFKANGVVIGGFGISGTDRAQFPHRSHHRKGHRTTNRPGKPNQSISNLTLLETPMQGYQITFFTQQDRMHGSVPLAQWLIEEARKHGIRGATLTGALQGLGHDGTWHAINMFDISDQPIQITLVVNQEEAGHMFAYLEREKVRVFYVKVPVEFGTLGEDRAATTNPSQKPI